MKFRNILFALQLALALNGPLAASAAPVSTSFTYQGRLDNNGVPVNTPQDFLVTLYSQVNGGSSVGNPSVNSFPCQPVVNGLFTLTLNFGDTSSYNCQARWLEFAVRPCLSTNAFQVMTQRVELLPTPYAIQSLSACKVESNGVTTVSIQNGSVTAAKIAPGQVVTSLNGLHDAVSLVAGANVTLTPNGNNIQISSAGAGGSGIWSLNGARTHDNAGNVGIGTANPSRRLEVQGAGDVEIGLKSTDQDGRLWTIQSTQVPPGPLLPPWNGCFQIIDRTVGASRLSILNNGDVGIGTITPGAQLDVQGSLSMGTGRNNENSKLTIRGPNSPINSFQELSYEFSGAGSARVRAYRGSSWDTYLQFLTTDATAGSDSPEVRLHIDGNGRVLINSSLDVIGHIQCNDSLGFGAQTRQMINLWQDIYGIGVQPWTMYFRCDGSDPRGGFAWFSGGSHSEIRQDPGGGAKLMSLDPSGLFVSGNASVCSLTIRGGCDLAEPFQMSDSEIPKGSLVIIDEQNAGKLKLAGQAYDTHVAGIVSGANGVNPGISLQQEGVIEGGQNVALSGRVYALADAANGSIKPGDLLTSSSTPGHVMKVTDHAKAQGAVVGKAMSALKEGKGMVLVLVTLQ